MLLGAVAVVLALVMFSRGSGSTVCPAIGYAYVGDVELVFPQDPVSVAACFGEGCTAAAVTRSPAPISVAACAKSGSRSRRGSPSSATPAFGGSTAAPSAIHRALA